MITMKVALRCGLLGCALAAGTVGVFPSNRETTEAAVDAQAGGWLIYLAEGQKAAQKTGKPIFLVIR